MAKKASQSGPRGPDAQAASDDVCMSAIRWLVRLRSGDAHEADFDAFMHWRAQSAEHARAADEVAWVWRMLGVLARDEWAALDDAPSPDSSHPHPGQDQRPCSRPPRKAHASTR
jgi:ferric-dicitrate binding protein FerR (iron transport regulator)